MAEQRKQAKLSIPALPGTAYTNQTQTKVTDEKKEKKIKLPGRRYRTHAGPVFMV